MKYSHFFLFNWSHVVVVVVVVVFQFFCFLGDLVCTDDYY